MCDRLIYMRGALRPADGVSLAREADALATREGIFETLLVADGVVRDACAHVDRLFAAADSLGLGLHESRTRLLDTVRAVAVGAQTPGARLRADTGVGQRGRRGEPGDGRSVRPALAHPRCTRRPGGSCAECAR